MGDGKTVLVSGAGIAGPTLAYWLARRGFEVTVVERGRALRSSGAPVDVRGPAVDVAERMGVMPRLRAARTEVAGLRFVNAAGRRVGRVSMRAFQQGAGSREVELPRGDLAAVLYEASKDDAEFVFDDAIATLHQDADGVDVTFDRGQPRRFDLVIGADGLHSAVRRLAVGPDADFIHHLGMYVGGAPLEDWAGQDRDVVMFNTPGRSVAVHPGRGRALAFFAFRSPAIPAFDHRDTAQHKKLLAAAFAGGGWRVGELLRAVDAADDLYFYFDAVSQVRLRSWSQGRVALVGDAASSVSLFGEGSSLAMAGAFTLAEELAASPGDHQAAFGRYEAEHRKLADPKQRGVAQAAALLVPATRGGILIRNAATRLWPLAAAAGWLGRRLPPRRGRAAA